jgi:hypothetical protein
MITQDNRILVQGHGYVKAGTLESGDYEIWDGEFFTNRNLSRHVGVSSKILLKGGNSLSVSDSSVLENFLAQKLPLKEIVKGTKLLVTKPIPLFNFTKVCTYDLGVLFGISKRYGSKNHISIPYNEYELLVTVRNLILNLKIPHTTEDIQHTRITQKFTFEKNLSELFSDVFINNSFTEEVWQSSLFLQGFLRAFFNISTELFILKLHKLLANDLQRVLLLFGVSSTVSKGLNTSYLELDRKNVLRFFSRISTLTPEKMLQSLKVPNLDSIRVMHYKPLTQEVASVIMTEEPKEMIKISGGCYMSNGVVIEE